VDYWAAMSHDCITILAEGVATSLTSLIWRGPLFTEDSLHSREHLRTRFVFVESTRAVSVSSPSQL